MLIKLLIRFTIFVGIYAFALIKLYVNIQDKKQLIIAIITSIVLGLIMTIVSAIFFKVRYKPKNRPVIKRPVNGQYDTQFNRNNPNGMSNSRDRSKRQRPPIDKTRFRSTDKILIHRDEKDGSIK